MKQKAEEEKIKQEKEKKEKQLAEEKEKQQKEEEEAKKKQEEAKATENNKSDDNSYWNLNDDSPTYNRWVQGNPGGDNEHLKTQPLYKYAIVLDYNYEQQKGKGGAIFIHLNSQHYTGGCIGLSESNLVSVMKWLDPGKNPKILTCS